MLARARSRLKTNAVLLPNQHPAVIGLPGLLGRGSGPPCGLLDEIQLEPRQAAVAQSVSRAAPSIAAGQTRRRPLFSTFSLKITGQ